MPVALLLRGGPKFLSGGVAANTRLNQQLGHPLNRLVIFHVAETECDAKRHRDHPPSRKVISTDSFDLR
jgi:hypothetical protein